MAVPPLDAEARRLALRRAVEARRVRAAWKARLGDGSCDLADLLAASDDDPVLAAMRVSDALRALPGVGERRAERILEVCGIAASRRLRGLGARQREALLARPWGRQDVA